MCPAKSCRPMEGTKAVAKVIAPMENKTCLERKVGHFCYCGVDSPLCAGNTQSVVAQPLRWKPRPKVCAVQPLGPIQGSQ